MFPENNIIQTIIQDLIFIKLIIFLKTKLIFLMKTTKKTR